MQDNVNAKELDFGRIDEDLVERAIGVLKALQCHARKVVAAESCTGGLVATVLSEAPGAAEHFEGGFVVYTPEQKFFALTTAFMVESMARPSENESASMASAIALISSQYQTRAEQITRLVEFSFVFADDGLPRPTDCEPNDAQQKRRRGASQQFNIQR
jgi:hypothetical protein